MPEIKLAEGVEALSSINRYRNREHLFRALKECYLHGYYDMIVDRILHTFLWSSSPQGKSFWQNVVYNFYKKNNILDLDELEFELSKIFIAEYNIEWE
jgi:hypothetical protein